MNKKVLFAVFSVLVILSMAVSPVYAITGTFVKDYEHPFVVWLCFMMPTASLSGAVAVLSSARLCS